MELMQLEMFVAVVEERSVRRAAERVFRTQPAVSIAVNKLQREIGMPLLGGSRHKGRQLTKAGEILYECASQMLGLRDNVLSLLVSEHRSFTGRLCIGAARTEDLRLLSHTIQSFKLQYPNVRVSYTYDGPENLVSALRERRVDMVFMLNRPDQLLTKSVLAIASLLRFERGRSVWLVRRRSGQSHLARIFDAMLPGSDLETASSVPVNLPESLPVNLPLNLPEKSELASRRLGQLRRLPRVNQSGLPSNKISAGKGRAAIATTSSRSL
jgi:Bacterial regulatory helix-turn-helix protein, lysR family/LysR substrate binding domain